jgi:hypothetical protein
MLHGAAFTAAESLVPNVVYAAKVTAAARQPHQSAGHQFGFAELGQISVAIDFIAQHRI